MGCSRCDNIGHYHTATSENNRLVKFLIKYSLCTVSVLSDSYFTFRYHFPQVQDDSRLLCLESLFSLLSPDSKQVLLCHGFGKDEIKGDEKR